MLPGIQHVLCAYPQSAKGFGKCRKWVEQDSVMWRLFPISWNHSDNSTSSDGFQLFGRGKATYEMLTCASRGSAEAKPQ